MIIKFSSTYLIVFVHEQTYVRRRHKDGSIWAVCHKQWMVTRVKDGTVRAHMVTETIEPNSSQMKLWQTLATIAGTEAHQNKQHIKTSQFAFVRYS